MKFKVLISLLFVGCVLLFSFIFLIVTFKQQKEDRKQLVDKVLSREDNPPLIPRTEEIPDEIRQKFAALPEVSEKPGIIAELVQGGSLETVEFSPTNPSLMVSRTYDANVEDNIRLWDINDPVTPLAVFKGDSASFSPDGKILAICDVRNYIDGRVKFWDIAKAQFVSTLNPIAFKAVFSPDSKLLALESSGLLLWDVSNPTAPVEAIKLKGKNFEKEHTFSADGKLMATIESRTDTVNIWEITGNQVVKKNYINVIDREVGGIEAMQFLPDPKNPILAIADNDENIRLYYPPDWQNYNIIPAGNVNDLAFTPDGKIIISGGTPELEMWSVENAACIASMQGYSDWVNCVDVSADGKFVAAGGNDGVIRIWSIASYLPKKQETAQNIVVPIYFLPTNRLPQADIPERVDKILRDLQTFFADEIQRHGFGRKTFNFEKNSEGSAKVYLFEGKTTDEYYDGYTTSQVLNEIKQHFELSNKCFFIIVDKSREKESSKNRYTASDLKNMEKSIQEGMLILRNYILRPIDGHIVVHTPLNRYAEHDLAAKFGDAFGLNRDYRHASYLMSYSRQSKHLSKSSAAWLSSSRFFNTETTLFDNKTMIETLSLSRRKARFKVEDADGISQVRLLAKPMNENHPPGFQVKIDPDQNQAVWERAYKGKYYTLHNALILQGERQATVKLDYPKFAGNLIELHVIDNYGNRVYVIKRVQNTASSFLRRLLN